MCNTNHAQRVRGSLHLHFLGKTAIHRPPARRFGRDGLPYSPWQQGCAFTPPPSQPATREASMAQSRIRLAPSYPARPSGFRIP